MTEKILVKKYQNEKEFPDWLSDIALTFVVRGADSNPAIAELFYRMDLKICYIIRILI